MNFCFVCLVKDNLSSFKASDRGDYEEFTGHNVEAEELAICEECKENLQKSLEFLRRCKEAYINLQNIRNRVTQEADSETIVQDECSQFECQVNNDELISEETRKISCKYEGCGKKFSSDYRLKTHTRTHTNEKPYLCEWKDCGMKFAQSNALICHKRIHLNEKPYVCKFCNKRFTQNTTLKTHVVARHLGNQLSCDVPGCDKKFPRNSFLQLHKQRDHQNIRNYKCTQCDKEYKQKSHLDRHFQASHEQIRHQCAFCEKSFSKSWSLKLHQFKHTEGSNLPYKCTECDKSFQRRDVWLKHAKRFHPGIEIKKNAVEINVPSDILNKR